ncbi:MAG: hypothetical protein K2W92_08695 [Alphaproteobacteria bacterium]|nr:hypothetical protein [Alphaproteobacteria bacterium]
MKNKISKQIFRRAVLPLITITFLSSTALGLAESVVKGGVSTQLPSQQVITKGVNATGNPGDVLSEKAPSKKSSQGSVPSGVKSLISQFEKWTTGVISTVKTAILPKPGPKTQPITVKKESSVGKTTPSPGSRPLPQASVVKKGVAQPTEAEKQIPVISPKAATLSIEEPTSRVVEEIASLLVSKPVVNEVTEVEVPLPPPLPAIGALTPIPNPAEVKSAADAVDELATTIKETTTINDELRDNEQKIEKLMLQTKALEEESLQGAEKQNVLLSNLKARQAEPGSRESFLESIRNPHALRKVNIQPREEVTLESGTLLGTLKQTLEARRVVLEEEESTDEPISTVESAIHSPSVKKTVDEVIIDNLAAIEAAQKQIAILTPKANLPLETGFTKQIQQQNRARTQAKKEIERLNGQINTYSKNNETLMSQKTAREEEIVSRQQKVLSQLKAKTEQPVSRENFLESIRNRANNPPKEISESTIKTPQKQEVRSSGGMKSLQEKIEEIQRMQELQHQNLPVGPQHSDEDWE